MILACALVLALPGAASACPVCYGAPGTQVTEAIDTAVLFMLGIIMVMMGSAGAFMWHLRTKAFSSAGAVHTTYVASVPAGSDATTLKATPHRS
ncbi:hypothetical protein DB346_06870 [Verrucomicrobia bacterium LW23]|nr:hypothetical protein DB346_06870 [Verrucomicrobia bacterium LW23]